MPISKSPLCVLHSPTTEWTYRCDQQYRKSISMWLLRLGHKKYWSFHPASICSGRGQLFSPGNTSLHGEVHIERSEGPEQQKILLASHKSGPPWKWILQPQSSIQMTEGPADISLQPRERYQAGNTQVNHFWTPSQQLWDKMFTLLKC